MPHKHRRSRRHRRKSKKSHMVSRSTPLLKLVQGVSVLPDQVMIKLNFSTGGVPTVAALGVSSYYFSINSCYNPDPVNLGIEQPTGFDEWASFYGRYEVKSARIKVRTINTDAIANVVQSAIAPVRTIPVTTQFSVFEIMDLAYAKSWFTTVNDAGGDPSITVNTDIAKFNGLPITGDRYSALVDASPVKQFYWYMYFASVNSDDLSFFNLFASIEYWVKFYKRKPLVGSAPTGLKVRTHHTNKSMPSYNVLDLPLSELCMTPPPPRKCLG